MPNIDTVSAPSLSAVQQENSNVQLDENSATLPAKRKIQETVPPPPDSEEDLPLPSPRKMTIGQLFREQHTPHNPFKEMEGMTYEVLGELQTRDRAGSKYCMQRYAPKTRFNTVRVQRHDMPDWREASYAWQVRQRTDEKIAQRLSYQVVKSHIREAQSMTFLHPAMYKTIWQKRVKLLLFSIASACRALRWKEDVLRKILTFAHPHPYGIEPNWGMLEMFGSKTVELDKKTKIAVWKNWTKSPCNHRKCFPVREYTNRCGDQSITVERSNDTLSRQERQNLSRALQLIAIHERRSIEVSNALDMAIGLDEPQQKKPRRR